MASVSEPAKAGSHRWSPEPAPQAIASRSTSSALAGPSVSTVHEPPRLGGQRDALGHGAVGSRRSSRARRRRGRGARPSMRIDSGCGICFASDAMRSGAPGRRDPVAAPVTGPPPRRRGCAGPTRRPGTSAAGVALDGDDLRAADRDRVERADGAGRWPRASSPSGQAAGASASTRTRQVVAPPQPERPGRRCVERQPGRADGGGRVLAGAQEPCQQLADDLRLGVAAHGADEMRERAVRRRSPTWGTACAAGAGRPAPRPGGPRRVRSPRRGCAGTRRSPARRVRPEVQRVGLRQRHAEPVGVARAQVRRVAVAEARHVRRAADAGAGVTSGGAARSPVTRAAACASRSPPSSASPSAPS